MSYKVKDGKTVKNPETGKQYPKLGEKIVVSYGRDNFGRFWWLDERYTHDAHGPFANEAEADADFRKTTFGEQCEVEFAGQWDPAWDRPQ